MSVARRSYDSAGGMSPDRDSWGCAQRNPGLDRVALCTLGFYLTLSFGFFGRALLGEAANKYVGVGADPGLFMWFLRWWPHAVTHGLSPFYTRLVWSPEGFNLAAQTGIPLASLALAPFTIAWGPLFSYNLLCLIGPALDAWCAFILCRYISRSYWAALLGGYIFGFSPFILSAVRFAHLHLTLIFTLPLLVYVASLRIREEITVARCTLLLCALWTCEFLLSLEVFATATLFAACSIVLAYLLNADNLRKHIAKILRPLLFSYLCTILLVSPYILYFCKSELFGAKAAFDPKQFSVDLLNFVVPTATLELGGWHALYALTSRFTGGWGAENGGYIGLPVLFVVTLYLSRHLSRAECKLLLYLLIVAAIASLGPLLHIGGREYQIALPYWPVAGLPLFGSALPARWIVYDDLIAAVIVSLWLAQSDISFRMRCGAGLAIAILGVPNASAAFWTSDVKVPAFFESGLYRSYIDKNETVLILPYGYTGDCMRWQAEADMRFAMTEGYGSSRPLTYHLWPIVDGFLRSTYIPDAPAQFKMFLAAHDVAAVVVAEEVLPEWRVLLSSLKAKPIKVGGVWLYGTRNGLKENSDALLHTARMKFDRERISDLMMAADRYLLSGGSIQSLSILDLVSRGMLRRESILGPPVPIDLGGSAAPNSVVDPHLAYSLYAEGSGVHRIKLGVVASSFGAEAVARRLRDVADVIYFPEPGIVARFEESPLQEGWLVVVIRPKKLSDAIAGLTSPQGNETTAGASRE